MLKTLPTITLSDVSLLRQENYVNGQWVGADSGTTFEVRNPATGELIGTVPAMGAAETRRAIEAAHRAYPAWRALLASERSAILRKLAALMIENTEDLEIGRAHV